MGLRELCRWGWSCEGTEAGRPLQGPVPGRVAAGCLWRSCYGGGSHQGHSGATLLSRPGLSFLLAVVGDLRHFCLES